jgi:hypothetical protein
LLNFYYFFFKYSPSSKVSQLPSEEDLDRATMSSNSQPPSSSSGLAVTTNPNAVLPSSTRQTANSKDDASIASGSSGCGSLTKKKTQSTTVSGELNEDLYF